MSITFNGISSLSFGLKVLNIQRSLTGDMDSQATNKRSGDGVFYQTSYMQTRDFDITFLVETQNTKFGMYTILTNVASWLYSNDRQPKPLTFPDVPCGEIGYTYYAYPTGEFDVREILSTGRFRVRFRCFDPFKYRANETLTINGAGDTILDLDNTAPSTGVLTIIITSAQTNFRIEHVEKAEHIQTTYNYILGSSLVIDFTKRYITLDGNNHMAFLNLDSIFFTLDKGTNTLRIPMENDDEGSYVLSPKYF